ncbi:NAD(P)/FAD-dependent oxidoreductase [Rubrimonas cliftonensis]|uniref:Predicted NAD/FAD-binding protein n=1 Tax=Rubrimonas cliftonensis TaxID=89524 RepID=A0A1H3VPR1_9RHOB|nr:FAD-dependent oxidoreductase [Rubrimonas cliftonensis]SDZ76766.1 Predicted NAD/FAD-binding protein [Rubrimonas cliftonensis]
MKIAVIGSGAAGLGASLALSEIAEVRLFEKEARFGGHANTVDVDYDGAPIAVDTGFIVFNHRNYPNLTALFDWLGVETRQSDMSFGFSLNSGALEYACDNLDTIFAQRRNMLDPRFLWVFREVLRFCRAAPRDLAAGRAASVSLGEWLASRGFSGWFRDRFILPMGGAIWSTPMSSMLDFPAESFLRFFQNHDLYTGLGDAMKWRTVEGGSREYVARVLLKLGPRAQAGVGAVSVSREAGRVRVRLDDSTQDVFDHAVLAVHGPQALALLADADAEERATLGAFRTTANRAVLHRDKRLLPARRKVWSSWNLMSAEGAGERPVAVSYWMNRLQGLDPARDLFVTLNPHIEPDPALVFREFAYAHPRYDGAAFDAQAAMDAVQGRGGVWHAGAWLGYGFHEDALRAGLRVAHALGARPEWGRDYGPPFDGAVRIAAQ